MCRSCEMRMRNIEFFRKINETKFPDDMGLGDPMEESGYVDDYVDSSKD